MNNSKRLFQDFVIRITLRQEEDEILSIAGIVFEDLFGLSRAQIMADVPVRLNANRKRRLDEIVHQINEGQPLQYILGEAGFFGRKFKVNPAVLIPRPETEEMVREVLAFCKRRSSPKILDLGTGSGCIPVTIALEIPDTEVFATDISTGAIAIAEQNAKALGAVVSFFHHDMLKEEIPFNDLDVIISNPPYIPPSERHHMKKNVVGYEPHLALFVPEDDPLLFYRAIAEKAKKALKAGGMVIVEINERFGENVKGVFAKQGYESVNVLKDISGKDRIVKAVKG